MVQKNRENLLKFFNEFFHSPSQNFKLHLFSEKGSNKEEFFADGTDSNTNSIQSVLTMDKLNSWERTKKVVCFTPNIFKPSCSTTEVNLLYFNALFVDIDEVKTKPDFDSLLFPPHYIFHRKNTKKYHAYWLIQPMKYNERNREKYLTLQKYLATTLKGDVTATKTPVRLMRIPFTAHSKDSKKSHYEILQSREYQERYRLSELYDTIEDLAASNPIDMSNNETIEILENITKDHGVVNKGNGRSRFIYWLALLCYDWAIESETAIEWVFQKNLEKCHPPEDKKHCQEQISLAYQYSKKEFGNKTEEYYNNKDHVSRKKFLRNEKLNTKMRTFLSNWVYVSQAELFTNVDTGLELTTSKQLNSYLMPKFGCLDPYTRILQKDLILSIDKITIDASRNDRFFNQDGLSYYNRFRPFRVPDVEISRINGKQAIKNRKSIAFFLRHIKYLTTTKEERVVLLNYISYLLQHPGKKVMYSVVLITKKQGVGKSMLSVLFKNIMGDFAGGVENDVITDKYTDFLKDKLLVFIHEIKQSNKFAITNKLKSFITEVETSIVAKFARTYSYPNVTNFFMFSNSMNCLAIDEHDRRFYVIYNNKAVKSKKYYEKLYKILDEDYQAIYKYLCKRDLSKFSPYDRPAVTKAKMSMVELSKNEIDIHLRSLFERKTAPFDQDIIILENAVTVISQHISELKKGLSQKAVRRFLLDAGYEEKIRSIKIGKQYKNIRCWCLDWSVITKRKLMRKNYEIDLVTNLLNTKQIQVKYEKNDFKEL